MLDYQKIAETLIKRQLRIKQGEVVSVSGGFHNRAFLEEIVIEVRKAGGTPLVQLGWESLAKRMINDVSNECHSIQPLFGAKLEEMIDCHISLPAFEDPGFFSSIDKAKLKIKSEASKIIQEASLKKGSRRIGIGFPTPAQASIYGVSYGEYNTLFWDAVTADLDQIYDLCQKIRKKLVSADQVRIEGPEGEVLTFSIKNRRINMDDGVMSDEDLRIGDITANLPFGEVYCAPVEESVVGTAIYPVVFNEGKKIKNLKLTFEKGMMVHSSATENHDVFLDAMKGYSGDKFRIGELGIGTNHEVLKPMGNTLLDEKIYGSIHLALGENRSYGGVNKSNCHWDMVMLKPTVKFDGNLLLDAGRYIL